jgi:primosomal protein N' (replication factor Y)
MLYSSELRSLERTFQILQQVIGRSGRRKDKGQIIIQTYNPNNLIFKFIKDDEKKEFYDFEIDNRQITDLPPFSRMAKIEISAFKESESKNFAKMIIRKFPINDKIEIFGPAPASITRLKNRYQFLVNIKSDKKINLQKLIKDIINSITIPSNIRIRIDIDPQ